uniref:Uncharacterized protein n=1 Tax=Tanacetum cinerariifolium TaxID=118510 RepID=A0A6L2MVH3_TANCI|nr:hypothetical protein [Tanacetum cinerariifolium]
MSIQEMEDLKQQYLYEMKRLINSEHRDEIKIDELKGNFNRMSIEINKKEKLQQLEQVANLNTYPLKRFNSFCYDDDDDEDYIVVITPNFSITDFLIMENEHLDTILKTKSDEFIKSSVENLVSILSEEDFSDIESECDMPDCDDSQTTNFSTFSNPLFDDSTSSDDESSHEEVLSLIWETILEIELAFKDKHCQPEDILELFQRLHNDVQNIHEELAVYINTPSWDRPTICYNDDDDEDCTIAITPILSTEEPDNSLSMGDKHLDTIPTTESDELIKFSVENPVPILSESEGIPDNMCDVHFHDNSPPLDISKDQFEDLFDSNDDSTSIDDDSFSIDDIVYVEASPPDSELVSLEVTNTFDNSLPESETFCFDLEEISSGSTTTRSDISLPDYEAFYDDHVKEISCGSTTTHSDSSLYDSFIFDLSINPFPSNEPNSGDFTMDVVEDIFPTREPRVHMPNVLPTHLTLQLNMDFILSSESLFAYVVWIFLPLLSYSVSPEYLLSFRNEDIIFNPGISNDHISYFMPDVSRRSRAFKKINVHPKHLNESPMEILFSTCSPMD